MPYTPYVIPMFLQDANDSEMEPVKKKLKSQLKFAIS